MSYLEWCLVDSSGREYRDGRAHDGSTEGQRHVMVALLQQMRRIRAELEARGVDVACERLPA